MRQIGFLLFSIVLASCSAGSLKKQQAEKETMTIISSNINGTGPEITLELYPGESFYYPLMAAWIEDENGKYIQTLYVPTSIATGIFRYGKKEANMWVKGPKRTPQTLPYWSHKRGVQASDGLYMPEPSNPVADAYTGATPVTGFILNAKADNQLPDNYKIMFEINQNWDWNWYWTNNKYPDDENYKWSCQPALVYEADVNSSGDKVLRMKPVGHSHYSGLTGELFPDLSTLTTALTIADSIIVKIR